MPSIADVSILMVDGTTIRTFIPKIIRQGFAQWRESNKPILEAALISMSELPVKKGSGQIRKRISFYQPIMETPVNGTSGGYQAGPKLAFPISWNFDWQTHARATEAQNNEARIAALRVFTSSGSTSVFADALLKDVLPT